MDARQCIILMNSEVHDANNRAPDGLDERPLDAMEFEGATDDALPGSLAFGGGVCDVSSNKRPERGRTK